MSVSLSSVYQQTQSLKEIEDKFQAASKNESNFDLLVSEIVTQATNLTMSETYRLFVVLHKYMNNNQEIAKKYTGLYIVKKLILGALHHFYIFSSVRILSWVQNTIRFQSKKSQFERAKLYLKQLSLKGNGDEVFQQRYCYKLLKLVDQFLPWFSENIPTHINAQFEYKSTFARVYGEIYPKKTIKSYEYFTKSDFRQFERNFRNNTNHNKQVIKELMEFISLQVKSAIDQNKNKSELLKEIVKTADSYCIRSIISELYSLIEDANKIQQVLKFIDFLVNIGQVQFLQLVKIYLVPSLLGYILGVNFLQAKKLTKPQFDCSKEEQKLIIEYMSKWKKITEKVQLSTKFYSEAFKAVQEEKKNIFQLSETRQKNLNEFLTNVLEMEEVNKQKIKTISKPELQQQLIKILNLPPFQQKSSQATAQWKFRNSAINQLNQFKDSKAALKLPESSAFQKILAPDLLSSNRQSNNLNSLKEAEPVERRLNNPPQLERDSQNFVTFRKLGKKSSEASPLKKIKQSKVSLQINKKSIEQSEFIDFKSSEVSNYEQYQLKRQKDAQSKNNSGLLKKQLNSQVSGSSINQSKSQKMIYFNRSEDYHSENSVSPSLKQSASKIQKSHYSISSARSFQTKEKQKNDETSKTYRFDTSEIPNSSGHSSQIENFGKDNFNFPQTVPKPGFGFTKVKNAENMTKILEVDENSLSKIINQHKVPDNKIFKQQSEGSEIKDLSKGRHQFNDYQIQFSEGSKIKLNHDQKGFKQFKISPTEEYFETFNKQKYHPMKINKKHSTSDRNMLANSQPLKNLKESSTKNHLSPFAVSNLEKKDQIQSRKSPLIIEEFRNDRLLGLEKELGMALQQRNAKEKQLQKKQQQYKILKSKSIPYMGRKVQTLKKEDEIIKLLSEQRYKQDYAQKAEIIKPVKNKNKLTDFFLENQVKSTFSPQLAPYQKNFIKQILGSRCLLIKNDDLQLGFNYSQVQNQVSFYLTFLKVFDIINIVLDENSLVLEKEIKLELYNQPAGYQLKVKRKVSGIVKSIKQPTFSEIINQSSLWNYRFPQLQILLTNREGESNNYKIMIPCSIINLAKAVQIDQTIIESLKKKKVIRSQPLPLNSQFSKNYKQQVQKYFPLHMSLVDGWILLGYSFPFEIFKYEPNQYVKLKFTGGKTLEIELFNDKKSLLVQNLVCLLTAKRK